MAESLVMKKLETIDRELHSVMNELRVDTPAKSELEALRKKLDSKEERELTKWSVELGRKVKKEAFKSLLAKLSPDIREKLMNK